MTTAEHRRMLAFARHAARAVWLETKITSRPSGPAVHNPHGATLAAVRHLFSVRPQWRPIEAHRELPSHKYQSVKAALRRLEDFGFCRKIATGLYQRTGAAEQTS